MGGPRTRAAGDRDGLRTRRPPHQDGAHAAGADVGQRGAQGLPRSVSVQPVTVGVLPADDATEGEGANRLGGLLHAFQNAAKRAKLPAGLRPYDLRHTRLTRWAATKPLALLQKAAGHASIRTTMGYVHLGDEDLSVLVESALVESREKNGLAFRKHVIDVRQSGAYLFAS